MKFYKRFLFIICALFSATVFAEPYMKDAVVSFYADDFNGKKTSNGEIFNMNDFTCASKTFPFDTQLKITNLKNGNSVIVRVNDRGPFVPDRELDLSKAAAVKLGMVNAGTAHVKIEIIKMGPNTKLSQQTADSANKIMTQRYGANWNKSGKTASTTTGSGSSTGSEKTASSGQNSAANKKTVDSAPANAIFEIQVASFSTKENAQKVCKKLYDLGVKNIFIRSNGEKFRVVIKNISRQNLEKTEKDLQSLGYKDFIIRVQK